VNSYSTESLVELELLELELLELVRSISIEIEAKSSLTLKVTIRVDQITFPVTLRLSKKIKNHDDS
jgi:hypothetical protein